LLTAAVQDLFAVLAQQLGLQLFSRSTNLAATDDNWMKLISPEVVINSARDEMATHQLLGLLAARTNSCFHRPLWFAQFVYVGLFGD
jgi:hypothetical protein